MARCGLADRPARGFGVGMLDPRMSRFWQSAVQSGLMDAAELSACLEAIPPEKRDAPEHIDRRLARQAVNRGTLTLWQARQLMAGRFTGFQVDRYVLLDLIGQGGMGRVYLARDTRLNRRVALKILSPERVNNPRAIARFQREARVGAQLQHENLIRIYDFGESAGRFYLVMEYIEGNTIGHYIATRGRMPPRVAASLARQVALGLEHAHRKGLIHRDVNPYNVMITRDGVAKLADLGLAIDTADEGRVTRDGATVGTFDYVAPEQARHSHSADIRSDIYSLGCTLYHMIGGQVPFPGPSLAEKIFGHQSQEPTPLEQLAPDVPPGLVEVVRTMMRKDPAERYESPRLVAEALAPFTDPRLSPSEANAAVAVSSLATPTATTPATATEKGSGREGGHAASDEFPIVVDLGPEPLLSDSLRSNRSWFGGGSQRSPSASGSMATPTPSRESGSDSASAEPDAAAAAAEPPPRRSRLAAVVAAVLGLIVLAAAGWWLGKGSRGGDQPPPRTSGGAGGGTVANRPTAAEPPTPAAESPPAPVSVLADDGSWTPADNLPAAIAAAMGRRGTVVLRGPEPIALEPGAKPLILNGRGPLRIRSARGSPPPLLKIDLKGAGKPLISTGPGIELQVENLIVEVADSTLTAPASAAPGAKPPSPPPPIFLVAGGASFDRCALRTAPIAGFAGSRAIQFEGGRLDVEGCWFEGFDAAIDARAIAGASALVRQTQFVPGGTPTEAVKRGHPVRTGWGLRMRFHAGGPKTGGRLLRLERCTFTGEGLIRLEGFSQQFPAELNVLDCAVRSETLLAWEPEPADARLDAASLRWAGEGNQLDVAGASWIAAEPSTSAPEIADFDAWSKLAVEREPIRGAIQFPFEPETDDGRLTPAAYAVKPPGAGADPAQVGPRP